jgi:hypothetical protein
MLHNQRNSLLRFGRESIRVKFARPGVGPWHGLRRGLHTPTGTTRTRHPPRHPAPRPPTCPPVSGLPHVTPQPAPRHVPGRRRRLPVRRRRRATAAAQPRRPRPRGRQPRGRRARSGPAAARRPSGGTCTTTPRQSATPASGPPLLSPPRPPPLPPPASPAPRRPSSAPRRPRARSNGHAQAQHRLAGPSRPVPGLLRRPQAPRRRRHPRRHTPAAPPRRGVRDGLIESVAYDACGRCLYPAQLPMLVDRTRSASDRTHLYTKSQWRVFFQLVRG